MKKVLVVASVVSFIEWFNRENIAFLKQNMHCEVHIACNLDYTEDTDELRTQRYIAQLREDGVILHNIPFARSPLKKDNIKAFQKLKKIIADARFDLIHCHTPAASMITRIAARQARKGGCTVMYTCHGFHFHNASPWKNWLIYYPIERFLSRLCDYLVTINREDFERAKTFHTPNVRYIPSVGVDIQRIRNTQVDKVEYKKRIGVPEDGIMILSLGELIERKNHEIIIRAIAQIPREDLYYVICGKGPLLEYLKDLAAKLGIAERVLFLGFRQDVPELCNTADISAFPSKIEGLGLAGVEAMAAGVPLVSSNVHGILDYVVDGQTGYACPPNDAVAFARAIEKLAGDAELRASMKATCVKMTEPFEKQNALHVMWEIYREILE